MGVETLRRDTTDSSESLGTSLSDKENMEVVSSAGQGGGGNNKAAVNGDIVKDASVTNSDSSTKEDEGDEGGETSEEGEKGKSSDQTQQQQHNNVVKVEVKNNCDEDIHDKDDHPTASLGMCQIAWHTQLYNFDCEFTRSKIT